MTTGLVRVMKMAWEEGDGGVEDVLLEVKLWKFLICRSLYFCTVVRLKERCCNSVCKWSLNPLLNLYLKLNQIIHQPHWSDHCLDHSKFPNGIKSNCY